MYNCTSIYVYIDYRSRVYRYIQIKLLHFLMYNIIRLSVWLYHVTIPTFYRSEIKSLVCCSNTPKRIPNKTPIWYEILYLCGRIQPEETKGVAAVHNNCFIGGKLGNYSTRELKLQSRFEECWWQKKTLFNRRK